MKDMIAIIRNRKGISLIELMVAALIFSFVVAFGIRFLILQQKWAVSQEDAAEAQQQARTALDLMARELTLLGSGVPENETRLLEATENEVRFRANLYTAVARLRETAGAGQNRLSVEYVNNSDKFDRGKTVSICQADHCEWHTLTKDGGRNSLELNEGLDKTFPIDSSIQVINQVGYVLKSMGANRFKLLRTVDGGTSPVAEGFVSLELAYFNRKGETVTDLSDIKRVQIRLNIPMRRTPEYTRSLASEIWLRNG